MVKWTKRCLLAAAGEQQIHLARELSAFFWCIVRSLNDWLLLLRPADQPLSTNSKQTIVASGHKNSAGASASTPNRLRRPVANVVDVLRRVASKASNKSITLCNFRSLVIIQAEHQP
ncbi:hypothetical protein Tsp_11675 [Trichinella spiralis]|uniref:hypothetical protein n=1 Tax=Trichinella spiralis TaxID=6334 RepID=UPI0001EFE345|nr:hypothetical protein Tsp_11675 [Trichinella spiralis]